MKAFCRGVAILLCGVLPGVTSPVGAAAPPVSAFPVVCPALETSWYSGPAPYSMSSAAYRISSPSLPIELVVLGTVKASGTGKSAKHEILVEKVLFGDFKGARLTISEEKPGRGIFALSRNPSESPLRFVLRDRDPAGEEKAVRALYHTKLEYAALRGEVLFLGRNLSVRDGELVVAVQRVLQGPDSLRGRQVSVRLPASLRDSKKPFYLRPRVWIVRRTGKDQQAGEPSAPSTFEAAWWAPETEVNAMLAVLRRQNRYPLVIHKHDDRLRPCRELVLGGSVEQAIDLLGSDLMRVTGLAARKLIHEGELALPLIVEGIERRLFLNEEKSPGDHQVLCNLIAVLGSRFTPADRRELHRFLDRLIEHIARNPPGRLSPKREAPYREEEETDVNHALSWLLNAVKEKDLLDRYASRLLRLRRETRDIWKQEVDLALDVCRLEDRLEVRAARERIKFVAPAGARKTGMFHGQKFNLAFSPDGKYLATAGTGRVQVWRTADWTRVSGFDSAHFSYSVRFTADGHSLEMEEARETLTLSRYDWLTGKYVQATDLERLSAFAISENGRRIAEASDVQQRIQVRDVDTGRLLRSWPVKGKMKNLVISPNGNWLLWKPEQEPRQQVKPAWTTAAVEGPSPMIPDLQQSIANYFTSDGRYLVSVRGGDSSDTTFRVYDCTRNFAVVASRTDRRFDSKLAISRNGKRLVTVYTGRHPRSNRSHCLRFMVVSLPDLKDVSSFDFYTPEILYCSFGHLLTKQHVSSGARLSRRGSICRDHVDS